MILRAYFGECVACGAVPDPTGEPFELDHVIPLSRGGEDGAHNRQLACAPCNRKKRSALGQDYRDRWLRRRIAAGRDPGPPPFPWPSYDRRLHEGTAA
jgi:5-methylcytosine-specific restriction endonuclease McrA